MPNLLQRVLSTALCRSFYWLNNSPMLSSIWLDNCHSVIHGGDGTVRQGVSVACEINTVQFFWRNNGNYILIWSSVSTTPFTSLILAWISASWARLATAVASSSSRSLLKWRVVTMSRQFWVRSLISSMRQRLSTVFSRCSECATQCCNWFTFQQCWRFHH